MAKRKAQEGIEASVPQSKLNAEAEQQMTPGVKLETAEADGQADAGQLIRRRKATIKEIDATSPNPFENIAPSQGGGVESQTPPGTPIPSALRSASEPEPDLHRPTGWESPAARDARIKAIVQRLDTSETYQTPLYWILGDDLIREKKGVKHGEWEKKLEAWGIRRRRATDAMSIRRELREEECPNLPVTEAAALARQRKAEKLGQKPVVVESQGLGDPLTKWEASAAQRLVDKIGSYDRTVEVLERLASGEEPTDHTEIYKEIQRRITPRRRREFRANPTKFLDSLETDVVQGIERVKQQMAEKTNAVSENAWAVLDHLKRQYAMTVGKAREYLTVTHTQRFESDPIGYLTAFRQELASLRS